MTKYIETNLVTNYIETKLITNFIETNLVTKIYRNSFSDQIYKYQKISVYWSLNKLKINFMELYILWRKLKKWDLLMSNLNVILPWFVPRLLLGLMFRRCFVIDRILVLIFVGQSGLGLLIFFVKGMRVLISWLIYDLFI